MFLEAERIQEFEEQGFVSGVKIFDREAADRIRDQFDALEAREGRDKCLIGLQDEHFRSKFVWGVATHPKVLGCLEAVMGMNIMLLGSHFFCKYPESKRPEGGAPEKFVAWHQDVTYWGLEPPYAITAWFAVDDSEVDNGCMRVIPGTHRNGIREHGKSGQKGNLLSINQEVPVDPEENERAVDLILKAGEISLHHGVLIHGSNPNRSNRRRCGLTIRYVPTSVKHVRSGTTPRYRPILVRGEDTYRHSEEWGQPFPIDLHVAGVKG